MPSIIGRLPIIRPITVMVLAVSPFSQRSLGHPRSAASKPSKGPLNIFGNIDLMASCKDNLESFASGSDVVGGPSERNDTAGRDTVDGVPSRKICTFCFFKCSIVSSLGFKPLFVCVYNTIHNLFSSAFGRSCSAQRFRVLLGVYGRYRSSCHQAYIGFLDSRRLRVVGPRCL